MVKIEKKFSAAIDVDPQQGFTPLCPEELPVPEGEKIAPELNAQAGFAKYRCASKDAHCREALHISTEEHPQYEVIGKPNTDIRWNAHCIMGTKGAEFIPGLPATTEYDFIAYKGIEPDKHPYGACYHHLDNTQSTGLIEFLKYHQVKTVIVGGLALDFCVKETVLQLLKSDFRVILNLAACRGINLEGKSNQAAIELMQKSGAIVVKDHTELESDNA